MLTEMIQYSVMANAHVADQIPPDRSPARPTWDVNDTPRVDNLRARVRSAMERPPETWVCPREIDPSLMSTPVAVRKAHAIALKLAHMPVQQWDDQLIAGSMTLEHPRLHAESGFPEYLSPTEHANRERRGLTTGCFGHIVPDYPRLLAVGISGIRDDVSAQRSSARNTAESAFLDSAEIALNGVVVFAERLRQWCESEAVRFGTERATELKQMAENLKVVPAGPAETFWQALQSVWLLHMIFHSTKNGNAVGRLDQYAWPFLENDLRSGRLDVTTAAELVDCFTLKFNERAKTTEDQSPLRRSEEIVDVTVRTRHSTSSWIGTDRDRIDATNHWLQNIIVAGLTPDSEDGTNLLSHLLLRSYDRNKMTNPLITVRLHRDSPSELISHSCRVLRNGGGMPAFFNDDALVPALIALGFPEQEALDYTNDGCWEVIIPGRTDFTFQRVSLLLCLERALNGGRSRITGSLDGEETGDLWAFTTFEDVWDAFITQMDVTIARTIDKVIATRNQRNEYAPVPLLSALIDGSIESRRDMTAGGARFRTHGLLVESAAHTIDSLTAIRTVVFGKADEVSMSELCDALDADFVGYETLRRRLLNAPKYGNDDPAADEIGRRVITAFTKSVQAHSAGREETLRFPCGVGTFSWYIGIGEGLGTSPDGRRSGSPVSSNFSPALGMDKAGIPAAIVSYASMPHNELPAGGPLDLRVSAKLVEGEAGGKRLEALVRGFAECGGSMMTITVADTEELRAAQNDPDAYRSLRVRMGGWCAYFVTLSREQQDHHIRRQEGRT